MAVYNLDPTGKVSPHCCYLDDWLTLNCRARRHESKPAVHPHHPERRPAAHRWDAERRGVLGLQHPGAGGSHAQEVPLSGHSFSKTSVTQVERPSSSPGCGFLVKPSQMLSLNWHVGYQALATWYKVSETRRADTGTSCTSGKKKDTCVKCNSV